MGLYEFMCVVISVNVSQVGGKYVDGGTCDREVYGCVGDHVGLCECACT